MYLGKVIGHVVCSVKERRARRPKTLLLVRGFPSGPAVVAVDAVGAGAAETVYVCRGREAAFAFAARGSSDRSYDRRHRR